MMEDGNNKDGLVASNTLGIIHLLDCIILGNWVFENSILANEPFKKNFRNP